MEYELYVYNNLKFFFCFLFLLQIPTLKKHRPVSSDIPILFNQGFIYLLCPPEQCQCIMYSMAVAIYTHLFYEQGFVNFDDIIDPKINPRTSIKKCSFLAYLLLFTDFIANRKYVTTRFYMVLNSSTHFLFYTLCFNFSGTTYNV